MGHQEQFAFPIQNEARFGELVATSLLGVGRRKMELRKHIAHENLESLRSRYTLLNKTSFCIGKANCS